MNWLLLLKSFGKTVGICAAMIACVGAFIGAMCLLDYISRTLSIGASIALVSAVIIVLGTWLIYDEDKKKLTKV